MQRSIVFLQFLLTATSAYFALPQQWISSYSNYMYFTQLIPCAYRVPIMQSLQSTDNPHTYTHIQTYPHTDIQRHIHIHKDTNTHRCNQTATHTNTKTTHTHRHTHTHTHRQARYFHIYPFYLNFEMPNLKPGKSQGSWLFWHAVLSLLLNFGPI